MLAYMSRLHLALQIRVGRRVVSGILVNDTEKSLGEGAVPCANAC